MQLIQNQMLRSIMRRWIFALILFTSSFSSGVAADTGYILVTGFEPFGGDHTNGSWEAVRHLQDTKLSHRAVIVAQLPVVWGEATGKLQSLIRKYHPVAVIAFGQAGAEPVRIELVAHNARDNERDNRGAYPPSLLISKSAPASLNATLNADAIKKRLQDAGIPVIQSSDAGGYLCNEIFFELMSDPETKRALIVQRGFIHVPPLNAAVVTAGGKEVLFDLKMLEHVADIVVEAVAKDLPN